MGVLGILVDAKRKGHLDALAPVLSDLVYRAGFWIDEALYRRVLMAADVLGDVSALARGLNVTASWMSNVETGIVSYRVLYSLAPNGEMTKGTDAIPAAGNGRAYTGNFNIRSTKPQGTPPVCAASRGPRG